MKRLTTAATTVSALLTVVMTTTAQGAGPDRPPIPFTGAWSHSSSHSHDGASWSESLSVAENREAGFADISVSEMVNGTTHTKRKKHVPYKDINTVLERLIGDAKKGLKPIQDAAD